MASSVTVMLGGEEGGGWWEVCGGDPVGSVTGATWGVGWSLEGDLLLAEGGRDVLRGVRGVVLDITLSPFTSSEVGGTLCSSLSIFDTNPPPPPPLFSFGAFLFALSSDLADAFPFFFCT